MLALLGLYNFINEILNYIQWNTEMAAYNRMTKHDIAANIHHTFNTVGNIIKQLLIKLIRFQWNYIAYFNLLYYSGSNETLYFVMAWV